jgi:superfamily II DNA or RNA helicase
MSEPLTLRPYQTADIERLRDAFRGGARAPLYQLSTGGGKTVVFAHVIKGAVAKGTRTLVLAHRRELIRQASAKLTDLGVAHGIVAAGQDRDHDAQVIVASIQTVARRLDLLPTFGLIVIDEAHHAVATTWTKLLAAQPDARLLGVTATPARLDGKGLGKHCGGHFDAIVSGPSMQELVDGGFLAPTKVFIPSATIDTTGLKTIAGDYDEGQLEGRAQNVTGDAVEEFKKLPEGTTAMVFCVTVKHATDVARAFQDAGYRAQAVHGGMPKDERDAAIQGLSDGRTQVLTSCEIISEGLDVPSVGCVILLRPTKSLTMCLQQIGRGMRPKVGGGHLTVLDHARNCCEHGLPTEPRDWSLDGVDKKPGKVVKPAPWDCIACGVLNPAQRPTCSNCGALKPWLCNQCGQRNHADRRSCSQCGALRPQPRKILEMDGAPMKELVVDQFAYITRMSYRQLLRAKRTEEELQAYARSHGYKPGWVWWKMKEQEETFGAPGERRQA